ncbi:Hypothetical protein FKW44_018643 [Caligus rogercresseyi]|uniref:Uncharacterized protein n=1 Tax=Caligus rogercresseyi TaxID=217165 RepID=A0A7T8GVB1_CALRO|nr:Hypothetical protein FKW44_018643 [Caligus rogercresseyi]
MLLKSQSAASIRGQLFQEFPEVFPPDDERPTSEPMKGPPMKIELLPRSKPDRRTKVKAHLETMVPEADHRTVPAR